MNAIESLNKINTRRLRAGAYFSSRDIAGRRLSWIASKPSKAEGGRGRCRVTETPLRTVSSVTPEQGTTRRLLCIPAMPDDETAARMYACRKNQDRHRPGQFIIMRGLLVCLAAFALISCGGSQPQPSVSRAGGTVPDSGTPIRMNGRGYAPGSIRSTASTSRSTRVI